jgi:hypothetical protein
MKKTDDQIMKAYWKGWKECPNHSSIAPLYYLNPYKTPILKHAWLTGWCDYIIGDDVPSHDYRSREEILKEIKG